MDSRALNFSGLQACLASAVFFEPSLLLYSQCLPSNFSSEDKTLPSEGPKPVTHGFCTLYLAKPIGLSNPRGGPLGTCSKETKKEEQESVAPEEGTD